MPGRSLTWLVLAVLAFLLVAGGGSALLGKVRDLPAAVDADAASGQSASQIAAAEFTSAGTGMSQSALRALLGEPEAKDEHEVEGLELACWYYGAGSTTGAYQFCFQNGRLRSKFAYP